MIVHYTVYLSLPLSSSTNPRYSRRHTTMWFCPLDGTLLQVQLASGQEGAATFFRCSTCPYSCEITAPVTKKTFPAKKQVDDVLGGAAAWENVDRTMAVCPKCSHGEAYFLQMQIRSADEPMSVFYKCCKCAHQWNDK
jgi:DNA-directed RNA polymerase III subunit RPC11